MPSETGLGLLLGKKNETWVCLLQDSPVSIEALVPYDRRSPKRHI
jgi:hypothetical protein